jgi:acyl carrier protein
VTRDEILALVVKHMAEAGDGLNAADIDPTLPMQAYDLNSLDIVEVITRSMRALQVKASRSDLQMVGTINDLVDALHRAVAAR